jgi:hypothetical protein
MEVSMTLDASQDAVNTTTAATAVKRQRPFLGRTREASRRVAKFVPAMLWVLLFYTILEWSVPDMTHVFFTFAYMNFSWLGLLAGIVPIVLLLDIRRIAQPNANKAGLVNKVIIIAMVYGGLWLASTVLLVVNGNLHLMKIFGTLEFFLMFLATLIEWRVAIDVMSFTQMRTVDMSNSDITQHDHHG